MSQGNDFAAEIIGQDLSGPLDDGLRDRALDALHAHKVVCYRDQDLTDDQFRDFALIFGPLEPRIAVYDRGDLARCTSTGFGMLFGHCHAA